MLEESCYCPTHNRTMKASKMHDDNVGNAE